MRIEDVKVGESIIPRRWEGRHKAIGDMYGLDRFCGRPGRVLEVDKEDATVKLDSGFGLGLVWWPVENCDPINPVSPFMAALTTAANKPDPPNAVQLLQHLHEREKADLQQQLALALKTADRTAKQETLLGHEVTTLRSQIAALEKQVADLKAERDRVGKTSQGGTRFAQLELD